MTASSVRRDANKSGSGQFSCLAPDTTRQNSLSHS